MIITLKFLGHACFQLSGNGTSLLFDPFISENPFKVTTAAEVDCNYILVSHGHFDHLGDAIDVAVRTGATIVSTAEIARLCGEKGCKTHAMHIGGTHAFDFGKVRVTPAFHGAGVPGGHACGFIVNLYGKTIYFAGDTCLFSDMELLGKLEQIDYALLPIGDNFTMGPNDAAWAVNFLNPKNVVPMHYNTWPLIAQSPDEFKNNVETKYKIPVHIINPGEQIQL